jgi:hypothetical protein
MHEYVCVVRHRAYACVLYIPKAGALQAYRSGQLQFLAVVRVPQH